MNAQREEWNATEEKGVVVKAWQPKKSREPRQAEKKPQKRSSKKTPPKRASKKRK